MNSLTNPLIQLLEKADCIIELEDGTTYMCFVSASEADRSQPLDGQAVWRIARYSTVTTEGVKYTRLEYPNGNSLFCHTLTNYSEYEYKYCR